MIKHTRPAEFLPVRTGCTVCFDGDCTQHHQGHVACGSTLQDQDHELVVGDCLNQLDREADPPVARVDALVELFDSSTDVLAEHILPRLEPTEITILNSASRECGLRMLALGLEHHKCRARDCVGSIERLKWAFESGCPRHWMVCVHAARGGHLEVLKWAREHGCELNKSICAAAAQGGHLEVLKWAREQGCPWDRRTCAGAAQGGHLELLKWAREQGCPWDKYTMCVVS